MYLLHNVETKYNSGINNKAPDVDYHAVGLKSCIHLRMQKNKRKNSLTTNTHTLHIKLK